MVRCASAMMSTKSSLTGFLLLLAIPRGLTYPIPRISASDVGALSFTELAQETFRRILELGFLRGILASLLVLGCLVCLLICVLSGLAAYLRRNDRQLWEKSGGSQEKNSEPEKAQLYSKKGESRHCPQDNPSLQPQPESRVARYILGHRSSPVTRIRIHTSSLWQKATDPPSSPSSPSRNSSNNPSPRSPSTPLRSALSKSPSSPCRFSRAQIFFLGRRRSGPSTSPKSVRWADQLQVSVTASVELSFDPVDPESEADIGLRRADGDNLDFT